MRKKPTAADSPSTSRAWLVLTATSLNVVLVFICVSSINVMLPAVSSEFSATPTATTWFVLSYQLVMTALIVVVGRAADIVGRKRLYIVGVVVFAAGSLLAGAAPTAELFVAARLVQGVGAASIVANTTAILTDIFPPVSLSTALGLNATSAALGQMLGPVAGGVFAHIDGWRLIFLGSAVLSLLSMVISAKIIPTKAGPPIQERMDYLGALVFAGALCLFVSAMSLGPASGWTSPWDYVMLLGSVLLAAAFILGQRRVRQPLVDFSLFRVPALRAGYIAVFLAGFSHYAVILLVSQYLQGVKSLDPVAVSAMVAVAPLATMCAALLAGRLSKTIPVGKMTSAGMIMIFSAPVSLVVLIHLDAVTTFGYLSFAVMGLGIGVFMTPNTSSIMSVTPPERRGVSNAVRSTMLNLSSLMTTAIGLAVSTVLLAPSGRSAVYSGTFPLGGAHMGTFTTGIQLALGVMAGSALLGLVVCLRRKTPLSGVLPDRSGQERERLTATQATAEPRSHARKG